MKKLLTILFILFWVVPAWGDGVLDTTELTSSKIAPDTLSDGAIENLIKSGRVCEIIGHIWKVDEQCDRAWNEFTRTWVTVTPCSRYKTRTCKICGLEQKEISTTEKVEVQREVKSWVDID